MDRSALLKMWPVVLRWRWWWAMDVGVDLEVEVEMVVLVLLVQELRPPTLGCHQWKILRMASINPKRHVYVVRSGPD